MKKIGFVALALAGAVWSPVVSRAISLDDIQLWSGNGSNRAALAIEWSSPEVLNGTTVPAPLADKTMVWGYRFNGSTNATAMLKAVLQSDPRLYVVEDLSYGTYVVALGYNLKGNGILGITDGTNTDGADTFVHGVLTNEMSNPDAAFPISQGDLYWGGYYGPNWEVWNEAGDAGGFEASPNRGANPYWTPDDPSEPYSGSHGQWQLAQAGLDDLMLTEGSWIGYSVASGGDDYLNPDSPGTTAYNLHKHAPPSPEGVYYAYVPNTNDFAVAVVSSNNVDSSSPYNDPSAMLGRPALNFVDYFGDGTPHRTKILEAPYWTAPDGSKVITEVLNGGEVTLNLGRKVYDDPNNPYGVDLIVYGNSFFSASGTSGFISDATDFNSAILGSGFYGHGTVVSVSQDGTNWSAFTTQSALFPDNAYRWDETNVIWTSEQMNPTKPLNPSITASSLSGQSAARALGQFAGSFGGTGYDLKETGLPWIQYVRLQPAPNSYTVIDAVAAVNPTVTGDALQITPANVQEGLMNLAFENPANSSQIDILLNFYSVNDMARVSTVRLADLDPFGPVPGFLSSAFQITVKSETGTNSVDLTADLALRVGAGYGGSGGDLRVWQWGGTNWSPLAFNFDATRHGVIVMGLTNLGAFVVSQYFPPELSIHTVANGYGFAFTPQPYVTYTLERSGMTGTPGFWHKLSSVTPTNGMPATLQDLSPLAAQAFYRLQLSP